MMSGLRLAVIISLLFSAAIIFFTIDENSLQKVLESLSFKYIIYLLLIYAGYWLFSGLRLAIMVNTVGGKIGLWDGIKVALSGAFVSNVTPFATGGGPFQIYFLHKKGVNLGKSSTVVVFQFVLRIFFFGLSIPFYYIFFRSAIDSGAIPDTFFYLALILGFVFSFFLLILILVPSITNGLLKNLFKMKFVRKIFKKSHKAKKLLVKGKRELEDFRHSLRVMSRYKSRLFLAFLCTIAYWIFLFSIMPVILMALGLEPNFMKAFVMQTIYFLIIPFMPTPGASGIAEMSIASIFASFMPSSLIGFVTFAWRLVTFYLVLLVGGIIAFREFYKGSIEE